ncbi:hypothetical protein Hanom_Chr14g01258821 [Helianthus anomalus]
MNFCSFISDTLFSFTLFLCFIIHFCFNTFHFRFSITHSSFSLINWHYLCHECLSSILIIFQMNITII